MKQKLIVLSDWIEPKEKTWSGTTWSLTNALNKYYNVEIKNLKIPCWLKFLDKCARIRFIGKFIGYTYDNLLKQRAKNILRNDMDTPVLEICIDVEIDNPYFTYQDMSYSAGKYVLDLKKERPYIWHAACNHIYKLEEYNRRIKRQQKEYDNAVAVFWMGKWVSDYMKNMYPYLAHKMYHVGGGTNLDINKINISQKKGNKFIFVGRDFKRKGGDLVVEAYKILKIKYMPQAELHIIGPEKNPAEGVDGVIFYGDISYEEVSKLMNLCDVFCMPSRFEAYGLVFIESLMYGLPCIGRSFFEMPNFIQENKEGKLIIEDSAEKLACLMYETICNKSMINEIQSNRNAYATQYSWDAVAFRIKKIIDEKMGYK